MKPLYRENVGLPAHHTGHWKGQPVKGCPLTEALPDDAGIPGIYTPDTLYLKITTFVLRGSVSYIHFASSIFSRTHP